MTHALHSPPIPNHVQAALEACCGGLMALQLARQHLSTAEVDLDGPDQEIAAAIESLQHVIAQLRVAAAEAKPATLALGFVLPPEDAP